MPPDPFVFEPRPDVWVVVLLLLGGYFHALATWRPRGAGSAASRGQRWCYVLGVAVLWLATDGPIDQIGERYLLSVHMVQFLLLTLVAPPLLLLGMPGWLLRRLLALRLLGPAVRALVRPLPAVVLFNVVIALSHWPAVVDLYLRSDLAHFVLHVSWFGSALVWWWPVLSPLPELPHLSYPRRMFYLFGQSFLPTVPASFLTFASTPIYRFYAEAPRLWGLSAVDDQQIAGLAMKIGGGLLLWSVIAALFFRWAYEHDHAAPDYLYWRDLGTGLEPQEHRAAVHRGASR